MMYLVFFEDVFSYTQKTSIKQNTKCSSKRVIVFRHLRKASTDFRSERTTPLGATSEPCRELGAHVQALSSY
jgi:hypothetical protein